jgi:hypothetical protein
MLAVMADVCQENVSVFLTKDKPTIGRGTKDRRSAPADVVAREQPAWQAWLGKHFPPPAQGAKGG